MSVISNEKFFDITADHYDAMINFEAALERRSIMLKNFISPGMKSAADLGCGTGLDSISLSMNGLSVTGFDISRKMISRGRKNVKQFNADVRFHKFSVDKIPSSFNNKYDFITSLGNTLANLNERQLIAGLKRIYTMLKPGSTTLIQILNYDFILNTGERIVKISQDKDHHMVRFYDFLDDHLNFNILKYSKTDSNKHEMITTKIYPHKSAHFKKHLQKAGFNKIQFYGNFAKGRFDKKSSKDLVITVRK